MTTAGRTAAIAVACLALSSCRDRSAGSLVAERIEVDLRVLPSGSVEIREEAAVRFSGDAQTEFERRVALDRTDSLTFVSAALDGRELTRGAPGETRVTAEGGRDLRVRWTFAPASNVTRVFALRYLATGAVAVRGVRGSMRLAVIPEHRSYVIDTGRITLTTADATDLFEGSGIAEAAWSVERRPHGIAAERRGISAEEGGTIVAELSVDPSRVAEPRWQVNEEWGGLLMPAFVSGGLFILVVGAGILWIVRFQYPRVPAGGATVDQERRTVRSGLRTGGLVAIALSVASAVTVWFTLSHLGVWPMAIPLSIGAVGLVFVGVSKRLV